MKIMFAAVIVMAATQAAAQTAPARPAAAAAQSRCEILAGDYRRFEMNLADRFASSVGDNSAPRATLRAMEDANDLAAAALTVQFMRDARCTLPTRAPVASTYMSAALACATARLERSGTATPPACVRENWQRGN